MNECNIIRDLMPLHADELLSPDSLSFIEQHTANCPECRKLWEHRDQMLPGIQAQNPVSEKKIIRRSLRRDRLKTVVKTLLSVLLVLSILGCCILQTLYDYGFMYDIEAAYPSPDGNCVLELVDRDSFSSRSEGYLIRFILNRNVTGINRYWTQWDTIEAHWAPDSVHLLLMNTDMEGNREFYVLNTLTMETQGGTWDIPGLSDDLLPTLTELCGATEDVFLAFHHWSEDSRLLYFDYETASGQSGQISLPCPTEFLSNPD